MNIKKEKFKKLAEKRVNNALKNILTITIIIKKMFLNI